MASEPKFSKSRTWAGIAVLSALAVVASFLALSELSDCLTGIARGAAVVVLWPRVMGALPLSVALIAFVAMLLLSLRSGPEAGLIKGAMMTALVCLCLLPVTPWLVTSAIGSHLAAHGYRRCPTISERPNTRPRWARSPGACPVAAR